MNKPLIALALCAGMTFAVPAAAQDSSNFDPTRDTAVSMAEYAKLLKHADCLMSSGASAEVVLTSTPNSKSERRATASLRGGVETCPVKGLENIHSLVRGSLAEGLYRRQVSQAPAAADPARAQAFVDSEKLFHSERDQGDQMMAGVMSCMVAASPQSAHSLLATQHGTAAEDTAMNAFFAAGQKCGAGASRPTNLSRSFIRAFVADSAWRYARTVAPR